MISRIIENRIKSDLFKGKTIVVYGARQIGKTTSARKVVSEFGSAGRYLDCELLSVSEALSVPEPELLKSFLGNYKVVILDEAQNLNAPGKLLKIMTDHLPEIQVIATGSSSFDLAEKLSEPMTGRVYEHRMFPLSIAEIKEGYDWFFVDSVLEKLLRFGLYPQVYLSDEEEAARLLDQITSSYLYRDILKFEGIRKPDVVKKILVMLALQIGSEVSYSEIAGAIGVNMRTVRHYIDILEKAFVIFRLDSFSRNLRNELSKSVKIYFYDNGIRNSLIRNFNLMNLRNDTGALWENFLISERIKNNTNTGSHVNSYFWRTYDQKEVDYIEEAGGRIFGYEFMYSEKKQGGKVKQFKEAYNAEIKLVSRKNYWEFIT